MSSVKLLLTFVSGTSVHPVSASSSAIVFKGAGGGGNSSPAEGEQQQGIHKSAIRGAVSLCCLTAETRGDLGKSQGTR